MAEMQFVLVILLQFANAGLCIVSKFALNDQWMSPFVLLVYRHAIPTLLIAPFAILIDRKARPKMTFSIFIKILLLGLSVPLQNLFYCGILYTTPTFASAACAVLPSFAFQLAWICRLENVNVREMRSQAKILGTLVSVGGAMLMTMVKGPFLDLHQQVQVQSTTAALLFNLDPLIIPACSIYWAFFYVSQAKILESYPAELSLTALVCLIGTLEGGIVALAVGQNDPSAWSIHLDSKLLAAVFSGVITGVAYYVQGVVMRAKGPVFVTAFSPLGIILVAIMGSFVFSEILYLGRIVGGMVIVVGLYLVLWGKSKDSVRLMSEEMDDDTSKTEQKEILTLIWCPKCNFNLVP